MNEMMTNWWTMVKLYGKFQRNQISHNKILNLPEPHLEKCRAIPLNEFIETIVAVNLEALNYMSPT